MNNQWASDNNANLSPMTQQFSIPNFDIRKLPPQVRQLTALYYQMGYHFRNINLPILALMHRSYDNVHNYERLEFLGDALLGLVIAEYLVHRFPDYDEGRLSRMRSTLVREATLVIVAKQLKLSDYLILGVGERKGGGRHRASILADSVEALIGAIYLDSGSFDITKERVLAWFAELLIQVEEQKVLKDAKSRLQECLQAHQMPLPKYELIDVIGNAPNQVFKVDCQVEIVNHHQIIHHQVSAHGESRRIAEQRCAEIMLAKIIEQLPPIR